MSESHQARGSGNPDFGPRWTAAQDELVRALPPTEVAAQTGRPLGAVYSRRQKLGLGAGGGRPVARPRRNHLFSWIGFLGNGVVIIGVIAFSVVLAAMP